VCESLCVSTSISPEPHARSLPNVSVHVAYGRGSVLFRQGNEIPREGAVLGVFLPIGKHRKAFAAKAIIPYRPGRGYGSAQREQSVSYDCPFHVLHSATAVPATRYRKSDA